MVDSKIILSMNALSNEQKKAICTAAPGYELVTYDESLLLDEQLMSCVEIVTGWRDDPAQWLLSNSNSHLRWIQLASAGVEKLDCGVLQSRGDYRSQ